MGDEKDTRERSRTTIDEAREQDDAASERGEEPVVPDYADDDGQSFRGVDEPTVPPDDRGEAPDEDNKPDDGG